jgi:hypothetical protein
MSEPVSVAVSDAPSPWLGVFVVELETNMRKERQLEGIARAKANAIYAAKGARPLITSMACSKFSQSDWR